MRVWAIIALPLMLAACGGGGGNGQYVLSGSDLLAQPGGLQSQPLEEPVSHGAFSLLLNDERDNAGVRRVQEDSRLNAAALSHAQDMVRNNYLSHTDLDGNTAGARVLRVGYDYNFIAENIARGYTNNASVVKAWMNSPSHKVNMIDERAEDFGLGRVNNTWVLLLGREFE